MAAVLQCVLLGLLVFTFGATGQTNKRKIQQEAAEKVRKLPTDICGQSSDEFIERKVINGDPATLGTYPWMAAIGYTLGSQGPFWNCGGSLITDQYVLTAAHCLDPELISTKQRPFKVSYVRVGDLDLDDDVKDGATPLDILVDQVIYHAQYDNDKRLNDIGLLKLMKKVEFTNLIRPICLPPPEFRTNTFYKKTAVVAGWGKTDTTYNGPRVTHLMEAEVDVQDLNDCRANVTSVLPTSVLDRSVICAASPGKDSCQGDSGGPLMMFRRYRGRSRMFLLGIVSYGWGCAEDGYPGVYTRVSEHMPWVMENLDIKNL